MKSLWKNKIFTLSNLTLKKNILLLKHNNNNNNNNNLVSNKSLLPINQDIYIYNRSLILDRRFKYCKLKIYNGKSFYSIKIERDYFRLKFIKIGSLSLSRRVGNIHKEKKKNNRKKK